MKWAGIVVKNKWQKVSVSLPHGQCSVFAQLLIGVAGLQNPLEGDPLKVSLIIGRPRVANPTINQKERAEPIFPVGSKAWP